MKKFLTGTLLIALSAIIFQGCKKDKGDPPVLPPAESMSIDFSNFEPGKKTEYPSFFNKGTQTSNWEYSAATALIWRALIYTTLAVPVKSFQIAVNKTPVFVSDNTWEWKYDASVSLDQISVTYKVRLTGQIRTNDVLWKMYVTKEGANSFTDFLWVEGTSNTDGSSGQWNLYQSAQNRDKILQIDWTKTGNTVGKIRYTYIKSGDPFKDSYIEYGLTSGTLNAYYAINYYDPARLQFNELRVEWSTSGNNGRVRSQNHFGNADWYCWDSNYINITCLP